MSMPAASMAYRSLANQSLSNLRQFQNWQAEILQNPWQAAGAHWLVYMQIYLVTYLRIYT